MLAKEQSLLAGHNATLVGVTYKDLSSASEQFARRYHITYPLLRDVSGNFADSLGATGVPETFVINRKGQIQALNRSQLTAQWLNETLPRILAEKS
jgi:cytochrome c biogenesis protein CcmG/thiol:disulfide interchange protein DsbE